MRARPERVDRARPDMVAEMMDVTDSIPVDHPSLAGHFPGAPRPPAALILARTVAAAARAYPHLDIRTVKRVKFFAPLAPGEEFDIHFSWTKLGEMRVTLASRGEQVMTAVIGFDEKSSIR